MSTPNLPPPATMYEAFLERDSSFEGVFVAGVRTTGIFCRPICPARKPHRENVEFFPGAREALVAGYRPCQRCRPLEPAGELPDWLRPLLDELETDPDRRWRDHDLRERGLEPARVRRWFRAHHGMTFHAYQRARRLDRALGRLRLGDEILETAYTSGYESLSGFSAALAQLTGHPPGRARTQRRVHLTRIPTPLGPMVAGTTDDALCLLEFADRSMLETQLRRACTRLDAVAVPGETSVTRRVAEEVEAYFAGQLREFTVALEIAGTEFQRAVWEELRTIPYGQTRSYAEQARRMGRPRAVRAVARANGDNRIAIVVPCHRVVGSDGRLIGYGGGLWRKERLLGLERGALDPA